MCQCASPNGRMVILPPVLRSRWKSRNPRTTIQCLVIFNYFRLESLSLSLCLSRFLDSFAVFSQEDGDVNSPYSVASSAADDVGLAQKSFAQKNIFSVSLYQKVLSCYFFNCVMDLYDVINEFRFFEAFGASEPYGSISSCRRAAG